MSYRTWARPRVLQHAGRVAVVLLLAVAVLASVAPVEAWKSPSSLFPRATPGISLEDPPFERGTFNELRPKVVPAKVLAEADVDSGPVLVEADQAQPSIGSVIAATALAYVGYPYAAGGAGPYAFDCSGFTQYIVAITTGIRISHAVEAQPWSAGYWVDYGNWLPGDLIYFQNTYRAGISHAAIYIGDGLIVHAESYGSGVTIDSIYSDYYGSRYYGAVRIG